MRSCSWTALVLVLASSVGASALLTPLALRVPTIATRCHSAVACAPLESPPPAAAALADEPPIDPKKALEEMGALIGQVQVVWTEGKTWSPEVRAAKRRELVTTYVRVFAPALAFSGTQLVITLVYFFVVLAALGLSGRGFDDVLSLSEGFAPLHGALESNVDPAWGNAAIALVAVEVSAPLLIPLALVLTPAQTEKLQGWLTSKGLDAEGINLKIEEVLEKTS